MRFCITSKLYDTLSPPGDGHCVTFLIFHDFGVYTKMENNLYFLNLSKSYRYFTFL